MLLVVVNIQVRAGVFCVRYYFFVVANLWYPPCRD